MNDCVISENIHNHPKKSYWELQAGGFKWGLGKGFLEPYHIIYHTTWYHTIIRSYHRYLFIYLWKKMFVSFAEFSWIPAVLLIIWFPTPKVLNQVMKQIRGVNDILYIVATNLRSCIWQKKLDESKIILIIAVNIMR